VIARIERGELDRARLMLKALLVFPFDPKRNMELSKFARRTVERARRTVEKGRDVSADDMVGLHELRISYKELRYSIELLADALPLDARAMLEPAVVFQKRLGEIHDVDVAADVLRHSRTLPAGAREQAAAALGKVREKRIGKYLRELDPLGAHGPGSGQKGGGEPHEVVETDGTGVVREVGHGHEHGHEHDERAENKANGVVESLDEAVTTTSFDPPDDPGSRSS
jgi:hypothetical protein